MADLVELERGGNTKTPRKRYTKCVFTLNNYSEEEYLELVKVFDLKNYVYLIGREIGDEGTPHLQGYVEFKKQVYFEALKKLNTRIHWEAARGTREQNKKYCTKDGNFISNLPLTRKERVLKMEYADVVWRPFQERIIEIIKGPVDDRKIYWFYEYEGNEGKSYLAKFLAATYDVIIADGKKDNVFNQIKIWMDGHDESEDPRIIMCDIPRDNLDYINYGALEQIKNGLVYSGKYEGGMCLFPHPHVIIFANERCKPGKWSRDRVCEIEIIPD